MCLQGCFWENQEGICTLKDREKQEIKRRFDVDDLCNVTTEKQREAERYILTERWKNSFRGNCCKGD